MNDINLPESVLKYGEYLITIKNKSENTIYGYQSDLRVFFKFMKIRRGRVKKDADFDKISIKKLGNTFIQQINSDDIYAFLTFCQADRKNSPYARARKVATLKSFFNYLQGKAKIIKHNPTYDLESPQLDDVQPVYLTVAQSKLLLNSLDKTDKNYKRDFCMITILLNTGVRLSELCSIKINKIHEGAITILGKGRKERTIYLSEKSLKAIHEYLAERIDNKASKEDRNYLLLSRIQRPISKKAVEDALRKHYINAGLTDKKYVVHSTRHAFATRIYAKGTDIRSISKLLGHKTMNTTMRYTHIDDETLRKIVSDNEL